MFIRDLSVPNGGISCRGLFDYEAEWETLDASGCVEDEWSDIVSKAPSHPVISSCDLVC